MSTDSRMTSLLGRQRRPAARETPQEADIPDRVEVVIVGGGLAGLETAKELEHNGIGDVLVFEAGPTHDLLHANAANDRDVALRRWLEPETDTYFGRSWESGTPPHYTGCSGLRRRLGGRSLYWYGVTLRMEDWALTPSSWPASTVSDLVRSWLGGRPLYELVENQLNSWRNSDVTPTDAAPIAVIGALKLRVTPSAVRQCRSDPDRWFAYSPLDCWRDPSTGSWERRPTNIRIIGDTQVVKVVVEAGTATGVIVREHSTEKLVRAHSVVLCAGTIENSRFAIQALAEAGTTRKLRLPGICDHMVQGIFVRLVSPAADRLLDALPLCSYYEPGGDALRANLYVQVTPLRDGTAILNLRTSGEQLPSAANYLECAPLERFPWPITVTANPQAEDLQMLELQRAWLQYAWDEIAQIVGIRRQTLDFGEFNNPVRTNSFLLDPTLTSDVSGTPFPWSGYIGTEDHEGCTLPLGSLLTQSSQMVMIDRLFVAGPCTFPRLGAANPALTTLALARRLAAELTV